MRHSRVVRAARLWCRKSPQVLAVQGWALSFDDWKTLSTSSILVPFSNSGRIRQRNEMDGLRLSSVVPKIQCDSNPHCPYGY